MMFFKNIVALVVVFGLMSFRPFGVNSSAKRLPLQSLNSVYQELRLNDCGLSEHVFQMALSGWKKLVSQDKVQTGIISICDFSQSANCKRLYVIDLEEKCLLFNSLVAHGRNTGEEFAQSFSNEPSSYKSSLGFYVTKNTYYGKHGLSLKLEGVEKGFNHLASERAIVLHGADYVSDDFIKQHGRLGRSLGCPSVPIELTAPIIEAIKEGSCFFIYYPDKKYLSTSALVR